jgi:hypothetical protein
MSLSNGALTIVVISMRMLTAVARESICFMVKIMAVATIDAANYRASGRVLPAEKNVKLGKDALRNEDPTVAGA